MNPTIADDIAYFQTKLKRARNPETCLRLQKQLDTLMGAAALAGGTGSGLLPDEVLGRSFGGSGGCGTGC